MFDYGSFLIARKEEIHSQIRIISVWFYKQRDSPIVFFLDKQLKPQY